MTIPKFANCTAKHEIPPVYIYTNTQTRIHRQPAFRADTPPKSQTYQPYQTPPHNTIIPRTHGHTARHLPYTIYIHIGITNAHSHRHFRPNARIMPLAHRVRANWNAGVSVCGRAYRSRPRTLFSINPPPGAVFACRFSRLFDDDDCHANARQFYGGRCPRIVKGAVLFARWFRRLVIRNCACLCRGWRI